MFPKQNRLSNFLSCFLRIFCHLGLFHSVCFFIFAKILCLLRLIHTVHLLDTLLWNRKQLRSLLLLSNDADEHTQHNKKVDWHQNSTMNLFIFHKRCISQTPLRPKISGFFDLCLHWVSVVRVQAYSDCLWRGFLILMYCDLLEKTLFLN